MQFKQKHVYVALGFMIALSGIILLINIQAQAPQKAQIVFQSNRDLVRNYEIYVMDSNGKNTRRLTKHPAWDLNPTWSPNGQRIAFGSSRNDNSDIYVMDADGKNTRRLTKHPEFDEHPAWSPDGRRIAFHSNRDGNAEIYAMDYEGENLHNLTGDPSWDLSPAWSPDGQRIAFESDRGTVHRPLERTWEGNYEIYVMDSNGKNTRRLTNNPAYDGWASWSPDSQKIAFKSNRDGNWEIYVMDADGKNEYNLTDNSADDTAPAWSPDGQEIAFQSNRDGDFEIYVMDADGRNTRKLTNNLAADTCPDWFDPAFAYPVSPVGKLMRTLGEMDQSSE